MEIDSTKSELEKLKNSEEEHQKLSDAKEERQKLKEANEELKEKIHEIQKETMLETSKLDLEIVKIENDLEGVKQKYNENNPKVEQITKFFSEAKDYITKYKEELSKKENIKSLKMKSFDLQRKVNDKEFENSQKMSAYYTNMESILDMNSDYSSTNPNDESGISYREDSSRIDESMTQDSAPDLEELEKAIQELEEKQIRLNKNKEKKMAQINKNNKEIEDLVAQQ